MKPDMGQRGRPIRWRGRGDIGEEVVHSNLVMLDNWSIKWFCPTKEAIASSNKDVLEHGYSPSHNNCWASCMYCVICYDFGEVVTFVTMG